MKVLVILLLLQVASALKDCPREKGFCVKKNGQDENAGVIKVNSVNGDSVDAQKICMAACLKHKGATGCEVIWDQSNRGCYIHTSKVIDHGNRVPHHNCWIFSKCTDETDETEYQKFTGFCATPDKKNLDKGESHAGRMDLGRCHKICQDNSQCTAYQYNGKSPSGDCWIHTSASVGGGTGNLNGKCYIKKNPGSTCSQLCQEWMDSSPAAEPGCKGEDCGHRGCLDPSCGENQYLSCAQACDARAHGATEKKCLQVCNGERMCKIPLAGKKYDACSDCDVHQGFTNDCHVGSRAGCKYGCTAYEASTGTDHGSLVNCRSKEFEQCLHNCVPTTFTTLTPKSSSDEWKLNRGDLILRRCPSCAPGHRTIVYKRLSGAGTIDYRGLFMETWKSAPLGGSNKLNKDFALYNNVADAQADRNRWKFCNYDDPGIGFPRDCGQAHLVPNQWSSVIRGGGKTVTYQRGRQDATGGAATNPCVLCLGKDLKAGSKDDNQEECKKCPRTCKPSCAKFVGCLDLDTLSGKYYEKGDRVVIDGDEACVVAKKRGANGQYVYGVDYHDGITAFEIVRPDEMRMVKKQAPACTKSKTNLDCNSQLAQKCHTRCNTPICVECMGIDFKFGTTDDNGKACNMCPEYCHKSCEPYLECTLQQADCESAEAALCNDMCSDASCIKCIGEDGKLFTADDNRAACKKCPGGTSCGTSCAPYIKCLEADVDCTSADARKCVGSCSSDQCDDCLGEDGVFQTADDRTDMCGKCPDECIKGGCQTFMKCVRESKGLETCDQCSEMVMEKIDTDKNHQISANELAALMARSDYEGLLRVCQKSCRRCENCRRTASTGACKETCPVDATYDRAKGSQCSKCVQKQCTTQCADPDKPDFCSVCKTHPGACPKFCTAKTDTNTPCLEGKGVGGKLVADNDCCAVPSDAGCKRDFQYSKGTVCYRGATFTAYKTVCTPISSSFKTQCQGKVWSFGDYFVDTSVDKLATCADHSLAITDQHSCTQASKEFQRVCGHKHVDNSHPHKYSKSWPGTIGCHVHMTPLRNNHKETHFIFNPNMNGHGMKNHYPVCMKKTAIAVVHGRNLRSNAEEI